MTSLLHKISAACAVVIFMAGCSNHSSSDRAGKFYDAKGKEIDPKIGKMIVEQSKSQEDAGQQRAQKHQRMMYSNARIKKARNIPLTAAEERALELGGKTDLEVERDKERRNSILAKKLPSKDQKPNVLTEAQKAAEANYLKSEEARRARTK